MGHAVEETESDHRVKPDGGYVHVSTFRFGLAWWAYLDGLLSIRAVRVLLALHELLIRRSAYLWTEKSRGRNLPDFAPRFSTKELAEFCGLPEKKARVALKELLGLGLVSEFSAERILFAQTIADLELSSEKCSDFWEWFSGLTKRKRVPLPRRILALACESSSPAQIAFIMGASLRCIYLHPKESGFTYLGWVSSAWLSKRFGVCLRAIKGAKAHLIDLGWISSEGGSGRFGERLSVNPAWERIAATREGKCEGNSPSSPERTEEAVALEGPDSAPLPADFGPNSAPPKERESFSETEIQEPRESLRPKAENSGPGIFQIDSERKIEEPATKFEPPVLLSSIRPEDFKDVARALELFRQAVKCGLVPDESEHCRLRWMASIERARTVPADNPAGVFLFIQKNKKWDYLSEGHWDAANERLKVHFYGLKPASSSVSGSLNRIGSGPSRELGSVPKLLSEDAVLIKAIRVVMSQRGMQNEDPLPLLRRHDSAWSRERLVSAELELAVPNYLEAAH